jgi:hypothetical protein
MMNVNVTFRPVEVGKRTSKLWILWQGTSTVRRTVSSHRKCTTTGRNPTFDNGKQHVSSVSALFSFSLVLIRKLLLRMQHYLSRIKISEQPEHQSKEHTLRWASTRDGRQGQDVTHQAIVQGIMPKQKIPSTLTHSNAATTTASKTPT